MKVNWMAIQSVSELKALGSLEEVKQWLAIEIGSDQLLTGRSFESVFQKLIVLQRLIQKESVKGGENHKSTSIDDSYFDSKANEYLFYLLELDGGVRMSKLGITHRHFYDSKVAKQWYRSLAKLIHPDVCHHPKATLGMEKLTQLYQEMGGKA